jgi:hypothetical protein
MTDYRKQMTDYRKQMTDYRRQMTENRRQRAKGIEHSVRAGNLQGSLQMK